MNFGTFLGHTFSMGSHIWVLLRRGPRPVAVSCLLFLLLNGSLHRRWNREHKAIRASSNSSASLKSSHVPPLGVVLRAGAPQVLH